MQTPPIPPDAPPASAQPLQSSPRRWVALCQLSLLTCLNCCQWINFATIIEPSKAYFGVTSEQLNWLSVAFMLTYVVLEPFAVSVFELMGLRRGLLISSVLNAIGAGIKLVCATTRAGFAPLLIGQLFASFAQIFSLGSPPLLSAQWFPEDERAVATAITATANTLGNAVGLLIPPLIITSATRSQFEMFFGGQFALCLLDVLLSVVFVSSPPAPPVAVVPAGQTADSSEERTLSSRLCQLLTSGFAGLGRVMLIPAFVMLALATGCLLGAFWAVSTFSAQLLTPFGVTEAQVGGMGFTAIALGAVGGLTISTAVARWRKYWLPCTVLFFLAAVSFLGLMALLYFQMQPNVAIIWTLYGVLGLAQTSVVPVLFELAAELTFPMNTSVSGGMLMIWANGVACVAVLGLQPLLGDAPTPTVALQVMIAFGILYIIASVLIAFTPEELKRLAFEQEEAARASSGAAVEIAVGPVDDSGTTSPTTRSTQPSSLDMPLERVDCRDVIEVRPAAFEHPLDTRLAD